MTDFNIDIPEIHLPDTIELDDDIDFSVADFSIVDDEEQTRILKPKMAKSAIYNKADFQYARDLAAKICLERNARTTCIVPGNFIFGDLPEALVMYRGIDLKTIYCSTLSLSENNVDSFKNLLLFRNVEKINLMLSGYFYSHYKTDLIPYLYEELDIDNKLQVAFTNTHMKILLMETHKGNHYVLTGSANLRSASCLEQFDFEENEELFNFYKEAFDSLIDKYKTIDYTKPKIVRGNKAWQAVRAKGENYAERLIVRKGQTQKIQFAVQTQPRNGRNHERKAQHEGLSNQGGDNAWSSRVFTRIFPNGSLPHLNVQERMTSRLSRQQANQT